MVDPRCRIVLDVQDAIARVRVNVKTGDVGRKLYIALVDGGVPYAIDDDGYVSMTARKPNGNVLYDERCTVELGDVIVYEIDGAVNELEGRVPCEVKVYGEDGSVSTSARFDMIVTDAIYEDGDEVEVPIGKTRVLLSPEEAQVGEYLEIEEVDDNGRVTKLKSVPAPSGSGGCSITVARKGSEDDPVSLSGYGIGAGDVVRFQEGDYYVEPFDMEGLDHVTFLLGDARIHCVGDHFLEATRCDDLQIIGGTVMGGKGTVMGVQIKDCLRPVLRQVCFNGIGSATVEDTKGLTILGDCTGFLVDRCVVDGVSAGVVSSDGWIHAYGILVNRLGSTNAYSRKGQILHCRIANVAGIDTDTVKADGDGIFVQRPPYLDDSGKVAGIDQVIDIDGCVFENCKKRGVKSAAWGTTVRDCEFRGEFYYATVDLQYGHGTVDRCRIYNASNYTGSVTSGVVANDGGFTVRDTYINCLYVNEDGTNGRHPGVRMDKRQPGSIFDKTVPWDPILVERCHFDQVNYGVYAGTSVSGVDTYRLTALEVLDCRWGTFYHGHGVFISSTVFDEVDVARFVDFRFDAGDTAAEVQAVNSNFNLPIMLGAEPNKAYEIHSRYWLDKVVTSSNTPTAAHTRIVSVGEGCRKEYTAYGSRIWGSGDPNGKVSGDPEYALLRGSKVGDEYTDTATGKKYACTATGGVGVWTEVGGVTAGADGGYYTPTVTQDEAGSATISWEASQSDMPSVEGQKVELPAGPQGTNGLSIYQANVTAGDATEITVKSADISSAGRTVVTDDHLLTLDGKIFLVSTIKTSASSSGEWTTSYVATLVVDLMASDTIDTLSARMDTFTALSGGSTTGDAELMDARVDIHGKTWANAGGHIRGITKKIVDACCDKVTVEGSNYNLLKVSEVEFSTRLQDDVEGTVSSTATNAVTGWIPVTYGKYYAMSVLYDGGRTTQPGGAGSQYMRMNAQKSDGTVIVYNKGSIPFASDIEYSKQVLAIEYEDIVAIRIHFNVSAQDISTAELLKAYEPMIVAGDTAEEAYQNAVGLEYIDGDAEAKAEVGYSLKHDETKADKTETAELRERLSGSMEIPTDGALVGALVTKYLAISTGTAVNAAYTNGIVSDYIPCVAGSTVTVDSSDYTFQVMEYQAKDTPAVYSGVLEHGTIYTVTQDGYVRICIRYVDTNLTADTNLFKHIVANISGYYDLSEFAKKTADPTTSPYYRNVDFGVIPFSYYQGVGANYEAEGFGKDTQYATFISAWKSLVANHSTYVTETELGAASDGQMLYLYDFSPVRPDRQKTPIPKIIITAGQHGWEKADVYGLFYFVRDLLSSWNKHPVLEYLRNHVRLMIVPVVNPYGFDNFCYKNGNDVNINRNYDSNWVLLDDATSQQYGGAEPFDQPESQIVRDLILGNEDALLVVDFHTCNGDVATSYDTMTYYGVCACTDSYYSRMQDVAAHQLSATSANFNMDYELAQPDTIMGYINMNPGNGILRSWATDNGIIGVLVEGFTGFPGRTAFSGEVLKANDEIIANYLVTALYYLSK